MAPGLLLMSLPAAGMASVLQAGGEVEEVVWESQELLSAFLCSLGAGPASGAGPLELGKGGQAFPYLVGPGSRAGSWTGFRVRHYFLLFPYP